MKLSEVLRITPKPVKIGTCNGSGFLFIGRAKDALKSLNGIPRYEGSPHWEDREVLESYNSALVIDSTRIIIIEGREKGSYWYLGESEAPTKPKKTQKQTEQYVGRKNGDDCDEPVAHAPLNFVVPRRKREVSS